ncbi:MAG: UvrD-helicase domain-containing protein [Candidatus Cloacimonetes bacterium]|nr:UvrD-helicase domain-containing protein [Candidatus Cloacimonadota bacterium]
MVKKEVKINMIIDKALITERILNKLNMEQQQVVTHKEGPLLVLAGAGSGKTRSVIHRVAWLVLHERINPWNILVVTFTNKAAGELRDRLEGLFSGILLDEINPSDIPIDREAMSGKPTAIESFAKSSWVGTFHSVCVRILRYEIVHIQPYKSDFTIFDRENQLSALKKIYDVLKIDKKELPVEKSLNLISNYKSNMILPDDFFEHKERNKYTEQFYKIYSKYNELLKRDNAMDFDDLLVNTVLLLQNNAEIRQKYQHKFKYIMIDEYQDTNYVQFKFIQLLSEGHQNICVVGDDDQAIYGWRGAKIENILSFHEIFNQAKIIKLEHNYRSSQNILNLANQLIIKNKNRHKKELWSDFKYEHVPELISSDNEMDETSFIADDIQQKLKNGIDPNEIVVLYRTNFQSRIFESFFATRNIPYQVIGSFSFFKRAEIKDMLAWLRFLVNPDDMEACLRIINTPPRGIGKTSIDHLVRYSMNSGVSLYEAMSLSENLSELKSSAKKAFQNFYQLIQGIRDKCHLTISVVSEQESQGELQLPDIVMLIIKECELFEYYKSLDSKEETDKVENIKEFITVATEFDNDFFIDNDRYPTITEFLNKMSLQSDVDELDGKKRSVKLMTMHCAKGLEFEYVYIAGLEEGILPHILCFDKKNEIEEERRLLYVAITRAKKEVKLNLAYSRRVAGKPQYQQASRFLEDIYDSVVSSNSRDIANCYSFGSNRDRATTNVFKSYLFTDKKKEDVAKNNLKQNTIKHVLESEKFFKIGQTVEHEEYGKGKILSINGTGKDATLTISFVNGGLKKINGRWVIYE